MNAAELRTKSVTELEALSAERRRELMDLRFKHYTGQLADTAAMRLARRDIARIETVVRERQRAQSIG